MINLLPHDKKRQILAGQTNLLVARYCIASLILAGLLFALAGGVYFMMENSRSIAEETITASHAKTAEYAETQRAADEFRANLLTAQTILSKEVHYSTVPIKIAQALPSGVVLQSLNLDAANFGKPTILNANGKSYDDALRLKESLERSSIFQDVHLTSVTMAEGQGGYPVAITISVIIKPEVAKL